MWLSEVKCLKEKKKICVISAYAYIKRNINYGSLLQYYALEKALGELGYDSYWLRFVIKEKKPNSLIRLKKLIKKLLDFSDYRKWKYTLKQFRYFIDKHLNASFNEYDEESLLNCAPEADAYITGSDQVWGGTLSPNYLCFVPEEKLKVSYAASFGRAEISKSQIDTITPWIRRIDYVSVREESGKKVCAMLGKKAEKVLDPTLLIAADRYPVDYRVVSKIGKFWFGYFLNLETDQMDFLKAIDLAAKKHGINMLYTAGVSNIDKMVSRKSRRYLSPEEWIGMYKGAEAILTNTFHGTVFALIFHKPFLVFLQEGKTVEQNERLFSLLQMVGLEDRVYDISIGIEKQLQKKINWNYIDDIISKEKKKSIQFLVDSLERKSQSNEY